MKLSIEQIRGSSKLPLEIFEGYHMCIRTVQGGRVGWRILGHLQEIWLPAEVLTLSQIKGFVRLEKSRRIKLRRG